MVVLSRCVLLRLTILSIGTVDALKLKGRLYALHEGRFLYLLLRRRIHYRVLHWLHTLLLYAFEIANLEAVPEVYFGHVRCVIFLRISYCSIEAIAIVLQSMLNASSALRLQTCS